MLFSIGNYLFESLFAPGCLQICGSGTPTPPPPIWIIFDGVI